MTSRKWAQFVRRERFLPAFIAVSAWHLSQSASVSRRGGSGIAHCPGSIQWNLTFVKDPLHILHLEDSEADAVLISHELEKAGLHVSAHRVVTREEFTRELEEHRPDVILSDHGLPNFDGFTALKLAKQKCPETPFIFVAESLHGESALETLKNGATDYILKSQVPQRLAPALRKALDHIGESSAAEALRQSEERFNSWPGPRWMSFTIGTSSIITCFGTRDSTSHSAITPMIFSRTLKTGRPVFIQRIGRGSWPI